MMLAETAFLLDVDSKWVLNALSALARPPRYSLALAQRLAVTRAIQDATGTSLARSFADAGRALMSADRRNVPVIITAADRDVGLVVDIRRILSSFNVRLSVLHTTFAPRQRGRPSRAPRDPIRAATDWGLDVTLLADNLTRTVEQRVRRLDAMAAFARGVQRSAG